MDKPTKNLIATTGILGTLAYLASKVAKVNYRNNPDKTYNATNKVSSGLKSAIQNVIRYHERYKNSYFWKNTGSASQRRKEESDFKTRNPSFSIKTKKGTIEVTPSLSISARNYYYRLEVYRDGSKSNISILKRML